MIVTLKDYKNLALSWATAHQLKIRFLFAGGLNTIFGLAIFPALMWALQSSSVHYLIILTLAQILGIAFSFLTNKFLVFRTRNGYLREFRKFSTFHLGHFLLNFLVLPLLVEFAHISPIIGQFMFSIAVIVTSYFWHKNITFKYSGHSQ